MEVCKVSSGVLSGYVVLDQNMRLVHPVNEYLDYLALRGRAANTLKAYARDLKIFFEFLERRDLDYAKIDANMVRAYVEHLRSPDETMTFLHAESKRASSTINRMIGTVYGFYCHQAVVSGIDNPLLTKEVSGADSVFKGLLYHTRKSNYTKQSIFKVKEDNYRVRLLTETEIQSMYSVL